jgi:xylulokinase
MVGTGAFASVPEACAATIKVTEELSPAAGTRQAYDRIYAEYHRLYDVLAETFGRLDALGTG